MCVPAARALHLWSQSDKVANSEVPLHTLLAVKAPLVRKGSEPSPCLWNARKAEGERCALLDGRPLPVKTGGKPSSDVSWGPKDLRGLLFPLSRSLVCLQAPISSMGDHSTTHTHNDIMTWCHDIMG